MKKLALLLLALVVLSPAWAWWNSTFQRRQAITVYSGADYDRAQIRIELNSSVVGANFDWSNGCADVRFADASDHRLDYWIEECNPIAEEAIIWVNGTWSNSNGTQAYLYYGNTTPVDSESSGEDTFLLFDDFEDGVIDSMWTQTAGTWTESGGFLQQSSSSTNFQIKATLSTDQYIIHAFMKDLDAGNDWVGVEFGIADLNNFYYFWFSGPANDKALLGKKVGGGFNDISRQDYVVPSSLEAIIKVNGNNMWVYRNDTLHWSGTDTALSKYNIGFGSYASQTYPKYDMVYVRNYVTDDLGFELGSEETYFTPGAWLYATIWEPQATTYYSNVSTAVVSAESSEQEIYNLTIFMNGEPIYENASYVNGTNITVSIKDYVIIQSNQIKAWAKDNTSEWNATTNFYVFYGLNFTVLNANGSAISTFNLTAENSTNSVFLTDRTGLIEWDELPQGTTTVTVNATDFDNESAVFEINSSMGLIDHTYTLYHLQYFRAKRADTNATITDFQIELYYANRSYLTLESEDGVASVSLRNMYIGDNTIQIWAYGYDSQNYTYEFTLSSTLDYTFYLEEAEIIINAYDELDLSTIQNFTVIFFNGSESKELSTTSGVVQHDNTDLPQGENSVSVVPADTVLYDGRKYYLTITPYAKLTLNTYHIKNNESLTYTFYVTDYSETPIEGALITIEKYINSSWVEVAQFKTNIDGSASFRLRPNDAYKVKVEKDGYVSLYFDYTPTSGIITIHVRLQATGETGTTIIGWETALTNISWNIEPDETYQNSSFTVNFSVSSSDNDLEYFGLWINRHYNGTTTTVYNYTVNTSPSGGTITYAVSDFGKYTVYPYFKKSGEDEYNLPTKYYWYYNTTGAISADWSSTFPPWAWLLISALTTVFAMGFFSHFVGGGVVAFAGLLVFGLMLALNPAVFSGISAMNLFLLILLGMIAAVIIGRGGI